MGCATGLIKAVMFIFNFLFVLAGLALIAIGALFYLNISAYKEVIETQYQIAPTLILIVGIVVFIIAFFGCCGVCKESYCMLVTYAVLLLTIFAIQLAIGIYAYLQVKESDGDIKPFLEESMMKSFKQRDQNKEVAEFFDVIQKELHCCGVNSPSDYGILQLTLPPSCCRKYDTEKCTGLTSWQTGCVDNLAQFIKSGVETVSWVAIGIAATELIGAIFAICLASTLKNESRRRYP